MLSDNKRLLFNTGVMYVRLIVTTVIGLLISRYVLLALGASDYGLYMVVGGLISMLNFLSTAMHTTTRRFINIEMGKPDGNLNRVFNISRLLHIGFALFIFLLAETIGVYYVYNYLNVIPERRADAMFVFQVSTIAAVVSLINVPYQALLEAYEKFFQIAVFDVIGTLLRLLFVLYLFLQGGDVLRIYALGMALLTVFSLLFYNVACYGQCREIIRYRLYRGIRNYSEILYYNNYVALGAISYMCRNQGSSMLVNFFFGTLVNAAFAIGYAIENYCVVFVSNISSAAVPQITQNYFKNYERSVLLTESLNRYSFFLMLLVFVPLSVELEFVLTIWLKDVPEGAVLVSFLTLLSALVRAFLAGADNMVQASGKIKWFQTISSSLMILCLPVGYGLYKMGMPYYTIIIVFICHSFVGCFCHFFMLKRILHFDVVHYAVNVSLPSSLVLIMSFLLIFLYRQLVIDTFLYKALGMVSCFFATIAFIYIFGLNKKERLIINQKLRCYF